MTSDSNKYTWEEAVQWLKDQPDQQELVRAAFYDDPLLEAAKRYADSSEWNAIRELLPDSRGKALDVGAGRGIATYALAMDGWQVTALEPDSSALVGTGAIHSLSEQAGLNIDVVETWGESLPFENGSFDFVHCRQVLHHANDLSGLCSELARVLKIGGMLIATREHVISRAEDLDLFLEGHPLQALYGGEHAYLLSEYKNAIQSSGFRLSKVLNPFESDINLYPQTQKDIKSSIAKRLHVPAYMIPELFLSLYGGMCNTPGRLYSFVARRTE